MYCSKCGSEIKDSAVFCENCGCKVNGRINEIKADKKSTNDVSVRQNSNKTIVIIVIIIAIALGGILYFNYFADSPTKVVEKFVNAVNEKDIRTAVSCLDPKEEKTVNAISGVLTAFIDVDLRDVLDLFPALIDFMHYQGDNTDLYIEILDLKSKNISGNSAEVTCFVEIRSTDSENNTEVEKGDSIFYLKKFNAGWRIVDIK